MSPADLGALRTKLAEQSRTGRALRNERPARMVKPRGDGVFSIAKAARRVICGPGQAVDVVVLPDGCAAGARTAAAYAGSSRPPVRLISLSASALGDDWCSAKRRDRAERLAAGLIMLGSASLLGAVVFGMM